MARVLYRPEPDIFGVATLSEPSDEDFYCAVSGRTCCRGIVVQFEWSRVCDQDDSGVLGRFAGKIGSAFSSIAPAQSAWVAFGTKRQMPSKQGR